MFFYSIFCILWILSFWEIFFKYGKIEKRILNRLVVLLSIAISSIRNGPIGDFDSYRQVFLDTNVSINPLKSMFLINSHATEPLYNLMNYCTKIIFNDFRAFIVFEAIFVNVILYTFCMKIQWYDKRRDYTITFFWIVWSLGLYNIIIIRQTLACVVCWMSIRYMKEKNIFKFIGYSIVATMIHRSALLWLPAYYIYQTDTITSKQRISYYLKIIVGTFALVVLLKVSVSILPGIFGSKMARYIRLGLYSGGQAYSVWLLLVKSIANICVIILFISSLYKINKNNEVFRGYCNLYLCGAGIVVASTFLSNALARLATPYSMLSAFIIIYFFENNTKLHTKLQNRFNSFLLISLYLALRLYTYINGYNLFATGYPTML